MSKLIYLKKFSKNELIYDTEETKLILKFIFKNYHGNVDSLTINDTIREFAQGLLLEAVEASYALGFVEALFGIALDPSSSVKKILKEFGKKALKHWFIHATSNDLMKIKIYEMVRRELERAFSTKLSLFAHGIASKDEIISGFVAYSKIDNNSFWS